MFMLALLLQSVQPVPPPRELPPLHGGPEPMTCPVGGEPFSPWRPSMYSTYGERPDGKPYSYLPFPFPVPECSSNHLIVFDEFSDSEIVRLGKLIDAPAYKRLIGSETPYYRAFWLASQIGRSEHQALGLLLSAIWQVTPDTDFPSRTPPDAERRKRYQTEFVQHVQRLPPNVAPKDRLWLEARGANALRQMARFADADRLRERAVATLQVTGDKSGWDKYLAQLQVAIARRDISVEPLDMIPERQAASACRDRETPSDFDKVYCTSPQVVALMTQMRNAKRSMEKSRVDEPVQSSADLR